MAGPAPPAVAEASSPAPAHAMDVVITAVEDSWVRIAADGNTAFSGTLKTHTTRSIGAREAVRIQTGNAGGVEITLNGRKLDALGSRGQVRSVTLTAEGPQAAPTQPTQPPPAQQ